MEDTGVQRPQETKDHWRKGQRVVTNHPDAVELDLSLTNSTIRLQSTKEPENGQCSKTGSCNDVGKRKHCCDEKSCDARWEETYQVDSSGDAMKTGSRGTQTG